ncbi:hypothetical protein [Gemmatimonas groenlandica]|uniref:Uncharacterized protein n=1 Tax=Gemmatimonas groenlandica TaxID=2732249 RepID=A0A6M4IM86_9BACT|nr:hypothetical protein [Gemmatimonas groenlandica]QJR35760.1 hypothetical protein HKW67_09660 [Gemmatimonas groenlandica]
MTGLDLRALVLFIGVAVAPAGAAMHATKALLPTRVSPSDPCSTHPQFHASTLSRIQERFDPTNTDTANVNFLSRFGLTGLRAANVVAVTDSSTCAAAIVAYANLSEPADSRKRQALRTQLPGIVVFRLSPNRYLLNAGMSNPYWFYEMFVTDSNFAYVSNYF